MNPLDKFKQLVQDKCYGPESTSNRSKGLCIDCHQPALPNCYSNAGRREYRISGLCEKCYDKLFKENL